MVPSSPSRSRSWLFSCTVSKHRYCYGLSLTLGLGEGAAYALERGFILADTKFEFGLLPTPNGKQLILIDEVLTPDSSRYWSAENYVEGQPQPSYDKQYLRDWLISNDLRAKPNVTLTDDVVAETRSKYEEAKDRVIGLGQFAVHGKKGLTTDSTTLQTDQVTDAVSGEAKKL